MTVWSFNDYKEYVRKRCGEERGSFRKLAAHVKIQTSLISQIFSGARHLTPEQACSVADFFELGKAETHYFVNLVQLERAGTEALKTIIRDELKRSKKESIPTAVVEVVQAGNILNEQEQALFYSQWFYSAIRIATSITGLQTEEKIAEHLNLSRDIVARTVRFLLATELCVEENGKLKMGIKATRVDPESLAAARMHINWRLKAIEKLPSSNSEDLFRTRVVSLSKSDFTLIKKLLLSTLEQIDKRVDASKPEKLVALNLDWFHLQSD